MTREQASAQKLVWDADPSASRVARFTMDRSFEDYLADDMLRSAVERQFEIIGEAFTALRRISPQTASRIAELPRIVAFRNVHDPWLRDSR